MGVENVRECNVSGDGWMTRGNKKNGDKEEVGLLPGEKSEK